LKSLKLQRSRAARMVSASGFQITAGGGSGKFCSTIRWRRRPTRAGSRPDGRGRLHSRLVIAEKARARSIRARSSCRLRAVTSRRRLEPLNGAPERRRLSWAISALMRRCESEAASSATASA
jgi:hypothetical protein